MLEASLTQRLLRDMMHKRLNAVLRSCKLQVLTGMSIALQWQQLQQACDILLL